MLGRFGVACQASDAALGTDDRSIDAEAGPGFGEQNAVRVHEEVANAAVAQDFVHSVREAAFGQPDALGPFAEMAFELPAADLDLGPHGVPIDLHRGEEAMRRAAGDDFQLARLEEAAKPDEKIVVALFDKDVAGPLKPVVVHVGQVIKLRLPACAVDFLGSQSDEIVDVPDVAILQERIAEHGRQGWRYRHGEPPIGPVALQAIHHIEKRDVRFGDGLVQPILLEKIVILGMANEGQVSVQDQA